MGGFVVTINFKPDLRDTEDRRVYGYFSSAREHIYVDSSFSIPIQRSSLLHELMHAHFAYTNLGNPGKEEEIVTALEQSLFPCFSDRRNAPVWRFIAGL